MAGSDKKVQSLTAFNSGEYSRDLAGRTDLDSFRSSMRYSSNFLTQVSGGLKKFYGTYHITEQTVENDRVKMIPFINKYEPMMFVIYERNSTNEDDGLKVGLIHGDSYKDLEIELPSTVKVSEVRWQQINDRLILCHSSVQPFSIDFYGKDENGEYVFDTTQVEFKEIPYFPVGVTDDYIGDLQASGLTGEVTLSIPGGDSDVFAYFPSILSAQSTYTRTKEYTTSHNQNPPTVNNSTFTLYRIRNGVETALCSGVVNQATIKSKHAVYTYTYNITDKITRERCLQIVKTICSGAYINGATIALFNITGHQNGDQYYTKIVVGSATKNSGAVIWNQSTKTSEVSTPVETTTGELDAKGWIGRKIKFYFNDDTVIAPWWQSKSVNAGDYAYSNGHWYKALSSGTCGNIQPSHTSGVQSDGGVTWKYVHSGSTTATVMEVSSSSAIKVLVPSNTELPKNTNNIYKNYAWSIWGKDDIHPSQVYMVGNRLGFVCNTEKYGSWNAMSVTDDYFNFSTEEFGEQLDTSAIVGLIGNNESSQINWVLARNNLYMGGYSGEYYVSPKGTSRHVGIYTPTETVFENISNMGGKAVVPLKYKQLNMFVGITGKELYTIKYDYTTDDYTPTSLGYLTQHIMEKGIRRMEALNNLDRNIYLLHDTNEVSLFNYADEQKVLGFTELNFADEVLDFATTYANDEIAAYVITKRNDGKITIERLATKDPTYMFDEITQGDGETLADFSPIAHFANREVYIKYGEDMSQFIKVALDENGDVSHDPMSGVIIPQAVRYKVGIPMVSEVHTQPAFGNKLEGHQQQSLSVYLRLNKSGAFDYGSSVDFNKFFHYEYWNQSQEYSVAHRLYTGDMKLDIPLGYAEAANQGEGKYPNTSAVGVNIKSDTPEPLNILSIQEVYI